MPSRRKKAVSPAKPLVRPGIRIGSLDAAAIIGELRQLHEEAADPEIDRMPDSSEIFKALVYLEQHAGALKDAQMRREAAIKRASLWQYIRERAEIHQAKAVVDARASGAQWIELMPALAVKSPSAAYNKATRLRAAALTDHGEPPVRRTPEAVLQTEQKIKARAAAARRAAEEAALRHELLVPVAHRLLQCRTDLVEDEDVEFWCDQIEAVLPHCETATQIVSLQTYLEALVRSLRRIQSHAQTPVGSTSETHAAFAAAMELLKR
ncbi:hypothetical protein [Streptomyces sp. BK340]|uniref:hypothetical protein n=1 Tax=Streptomyces sp. BK340 TaxID=2572903 RepID=UPI0011A4B57E|nr:hypothetical protein [Streptomyces sp. BK340]